MGEALTTPFAKKDDQFYVKFQNLYENSDQFSGLHKKNSPITSKNYKEDDHIIVKVQRTNQPHQLLQILNLFQKQPFKYFRKVQIIKQDNQCCNSTLVRTQIYNYRKISLENLLTMKRLKHQRFAESQIWYLIKSCVQFFCYMSNRGLPYGNIIPRKFLKVDVMHFINGENYCNQLNIKGYYAPQYINCFIQAKVKFGKVQRKERLKNIDIFRSQIFSFGLLLLQLCTCPDPHPKFHKYNFKEFLWDQVRKKIIIAHQYFSQKLIWLIGLMLRQESLLRPDWNYLSMWLRKFIQNEQVDIAPCIFWSI